MAKKPSHDDYKAKPNDFDVFEFIAGIIHWYLMRTGIGPIIWVFLYFKFGWDNIKFGTAIFIILWILYYSTLIGNSKTQNRKAKKKIDGCLFIIIGFSLLFLLFYYLQ
tara:strand:- start:844 stop:1167 length:324 start_codon:yes stop_codon:yes gene_type:complete